MQNIKILLLVLIGLILINSCSSDDDNNNTCPQSEIISMKINGELKQFEVNGWGIDLDYDDSGHTLSLWLFSGKFQPQQDSYAITLKLPYKKTDTNIIEEFNYFRVQKGTSAESDFVVEGKLESNVLVNTNSCFSATFSGNAIVNGNEIVITDGIVKHIYNEPFD
ncbi:hypothetical protein FUA26_01045 [Seonamhaeicola algicola]|uniref:Uncharacterized protein n=1 Tax=Seonamhaeicola algicola TaxID=1719036 RepID=A0A5C7B3U0_9FLAO|nr:hypothetical protein [Seonamhaeicola algicola]TXE15124.1 hypothetical protein FUA26_01045 [Seonamhaeicola algicola]